MFNTHSTHKRKSNENIQSRILKWKVENEWQQKIEKKEIHVHQFSSVAAAAMAKENMGKYWEENNTSVNWIGVAAEYPALVSHRPPSSLCV